MNPLDEKAKFLERDFNQCFDQMRHYDTQIIDIFKFSLTFYTFIIASIITLFELQKTHHLNTENSMVALILFTILAGLLMLCLILRNRLYFVKVTQYINEHRAFYLRDNPLQFTNQTHMYTDPARPNLFHPVSSHALLVYILAIFNASLLVLLFNLLFNAFLWILSLVIFLLFILVQLLMIRILLKTHKEFKA